MARLVLEARTAEWTSGDVVREWLVGVAVSRADDGTPVSGLAAENFRVAAQFGEARRGKRIFDGVGRCANCHMPPTFTDSGWNLHTGSQVCIDDFQANRSPTFRYRTTPLRGVVAKLKGGFYHDGRFPTLPRVVDHYNSCFRLGLNAHQKHDLVQYLRGL